MKHASAMWLLWGHKGQPRGSKEPEEKSLSVQALAVLRPWESLGHSIQVHLRKETHFHAEKQHQLLH